MAEADLPTGVWRRSPPLIYPLRDALGIVLAAMTECLKPTFKAAQILSGLMDQNMDGVADDEALASQLSQWSTAWLAMPWDPERWENNRPQLQRAWATISSFRVGGWKTARGQSQAFKSVP